MKREVLIKIITIYDIDEYGNNFYSKNYNNDIIGRNIASQLITLDYITKVSIELPIDTNFHPPKVVTRIRGYIKINDFLKN